MIKIKIAEDPIMSEYTIDITGHADYAEKGKDIVCAGASAIFFTMLKYLEEKRSDYSAAVTDNKSVVCVKNGNFPESYLLEIALCGFKMLAKEYPEYVGISYVNKQKKGENFTLNLG